MMHPFKPVLPEQWHRFIDEVERHLGEKLFDPRRDTAMMVTVFHASVQACGEGASPASFANVLKGRLH